MTTNEVGISARQAENKIYISNSNILEFDLWLVARAFFPSAFLRAYFFVLLLLLLLGSSFSYICVFVFVLPFSILLLLLSCSVWQEAEHWDESLRAGMLTQWCRLFDSLSSLSLVWFYISICTAAKERGRIQLRERAWWRRLATGDVAGFWSAPSHSLL